MSSSISLKIFFDDQIRRLKFSKDSKYKAFVKTIYEILKQRDEKVQIENLKYSFSYTDNEGDVV